ncbi:MAG: hypothetical protein ACI8RE_002661, partial [Ilumatobacter sp.]
NPFPDHLRFSWVLTPTETPTQAPTQAPTETPTETGAASLRSVERA